MTKYVLNSGNVWGYPTLAKKFFHEVLKDQGPKPKLLICCFAQPREDWEQKFAKDESFIPECVDDLKPALELAFPDTFVEQIKKSDAIYIHGGDDHLLQYWLRKFELPKIWEGKVVATNSASSHALAKHFWTCDWRQCMEGLGILPIKYLAHYESSFGADDPRGPIDWIAAYKELENYGNKSLPVHAIHEGEFVLIEK